MTPIPSRRVRRPDMTWEIFKFELKYHLRQPLFYILFVIFFFLTFGAVTSDAVTLGGALGNVNRNAPFVIMQLLLVMSTFGVLTTTAYVASAINRDFEYNTDSFFFSSPIKKAQYLFGRFSAAFIVSGLIYLGVITAIMIGSKMPWLDKERLGAFVFKPYVFSYFALVLPNLLLFGAIFFAVAALTRSLMATYTSVAAFYVAYIISRVSLRDIESEKLGSLLDPFSIAPFGRATRYWTVFEKNSSVLPLDGIFLWNRLLWLGVAIVLLGLTFVFFKMEVGTAGGKKKKKTSAASEEPLDRASLALPKVTQRFDASTSWRQYVTTIRVETRSILKSLPFFVILLLAVLNTVGGATFANRIFGTEFYPVTYVMTGAIEGSFLFFAVIIAAFYAGEIVFRERMLKLNEVTDTMPAPTWSMWAGKLTALFITLYIALTAAVLTTIAVQAAKHYYNFELGLYFRGVFLVLGIQLLMITVLMFFGQIITNNRYVGFLIALFFIISQSVMQALHYEHRLYSVFNPPDMTYSAMNGYGHFTRPFEWLSLYWTIFAAILLIVGHLFWVRGTETAMKIRMRVARGRFGKPVFATLALLVAAFGATGCYIFYNTNVLNHYTTEDQRDKRAAETEKLYKKYDRIPQPRITDVQADVDIHPDKRWVDIRGTYTLVNKTAQPIRDLHIVMTPEMATTIRIPGATLAQNDPMHGYFIYRLAQPLAPGATLPMSFTVQIHHRGFENTSRDNTIVENGTFFNNFATFPHLGYNPGAELQEAHKRRKYGLAPVVRMAKIDDPKARMDNQITRDADWINLDTTVSTSPDQIAIAPGYLQKEWTSNGRRYFRYKTTSPDPGLLGIPLGALRGEAELLERCPDRDLLRPETRLQRRPHDLWRAEVTRLLHRQFLAVSAQAGAHPGVPAVRTIRAVVPEHDPLLGVDRLHRRSPQQGGDRLRLLRHRARGRAPVVGTSGDRRGRAGGSDAGRDDGPVLGADGDGEGVRPRQDAALPQVRARPLPRRPRRRAGGGNAADARREPALYPLPQRQPGHVRVARRDRRREGQRRATSTHPRPRIRTAALRHDARPHRRLPRPNPAGEAVAGHGSLRDHHAVRQQDHRGHGEQTSGR
jgi:ABC-2 type transport system permease protein